MRRSDTLLDRERELADVAALLDRARAGDGGALLIEGGIGIGKTAILDAAARMAGDMRVRRGRGGEVEREVGFGLVRELLAPPLRSAAPAVRERWLSGAASSAAGVLDEESGASVDVAAVAYGLFWLLAAIAAERPVVLIADDLHDCDPASRRWLGY